MKDSVEITEKYGLISKEEKEAYFAKDDNGISRFDQDVEKVSQTKVKLRDKLLYATSKIATSLGVKAVSHYLNKQISKEGKMVIDPNARMEALKHRAKKIGHRIGKLRHSVSSNVRNTPVSAKRETSNRRSI